MALTRQEADTRTEWGRARLLAYFGHHKCASSWLTDITREIAAAAGLRYVHFHNPRMFQRDLRTYVERNDVGFLAYVNANRTYVSALDDFRGFHVIRDPRDIVVSSYFSHLHSHPTTDWPELVDHRRELESVGKDRGLYVVIDFLSDVLDDMATWNYSNPRILELKMEDVARAPVERLREAFGFIGLVDSRRTGVSADIASALASIKRRRPWMVPFRIVPLPASSLDASMRRNAYEVKASGRAKGVENVSSHYRKGVAGDWVNHFGPEHREYFKARYGDLLVKLGYESGLDW
jgi:hypothetical protein